MQQPLCKALNRFCCNIYSRKHDESQDQIGIVSTVTQEGIYVLDGCIFCKSLSRYAAASKSSSEAIDPQIPALGKLKQRGGNSFTLCIGSVALTFCSIMPLEWRLSPKATFDEPWPESMLIPQWLSQCVEQHHKCKLATADRKLPKRLLYVSSFDNSDDIRLVESQTIPKSDTIEYVALSHCWGPPEKQPLRTTVNTLRDRQKRIKFADLPLTFQDAVKICRNINQKFLWIDSVCIVQDDGDDWEEQASEMAFIYGHSFLTLAALSSENGTQGCRIRPRPRYKGNLSHYQDFDIGTNRIRCFDRPPASWQYEYGDGVYKSDDYGTNPLRRRAWTLQERELPVRSLHFSQGQLLWQCRTMRGSSELPWTTIEQEYEDESTPTLLIYRDQEEHPNLESEPYSRTRWFQLVEDYSSRHLTNEMDKLPALIGLADDFARTHHFDNHDYLAGIWSSHLPSALLWNVVASRPRRPQAYRAPSWSWASLEGAISYDSQRLPDERIRDEPVPGFHFEILRWDCPSIKAFKSLNSTSPAVLQVRGGLTKLKIGLPLTEQETGRAVYRLAGEDEETVGVLDPDLAEDLTGLSSVFVMNIDFELYSGLIPCPIELSWDHRALCGIGLALLENGVEDTYWRVGLARWLMPKVYETTILAQVRIV